MIAHPHIKFSPCGLLRYDNRHPKLFDNVMPIVLVLRMGKTLLRMGNEVLQITKAYYLFIKKVTINSQNSFELPIETN